MQALFPGSFDPITVGHVDLITRASHLFSSVVVVVADNPDKHGWLSVAQRVALVEKAIAVLPNVTVTATDALTVAFARKVGAQVIVRGIRNTQDDEFERNLAAVNYHLDPTIETVLLPSKPQLTFVSSSAVREIIRFGGDPKGLVPPVVVEALGRMRDNERTN
ncbi:pantetheine-phosphate adenylyltransferase [Ligilactobacillus sp. LYQ139]|uniref:pantetheine-phosphate adenylyltransferase n=1 Tax=Ligilactobacillus sp. LYQ139 TaxID=3378800 RepID=UPI003853F7F2